MFCCQNKRANVQVVVPLEIRWRWQVPDFEVIIEKQCLAVGTKEQNWSLQKNKREDAGEISPIFDGELSAPIVLMSASFWRFDSDKKNERTVLIITLRKVFAFSAFFLLSIFLYSKIQGRCGRASLRMRRNARIPSKSRSRQSRRNTLQQRGRTINKM